jgi:hypothetical protein
MKRLALIAALLSTAAIAQADDRQWQYDHHGDYDRRTDEGRREVDNAHRGWVSLATMDISRKETVDIDPRFRFSRLRIQAARGAAYVDFVTIRYGNGEQQHVDVHRRIGRGEYADIEVNGRHLQAITVHGRPDRWSQIQVIAQQ